MDTGKMSEPNPWSEDSDDDFVNKPPASKASALKIMPLKRAKPDEPTEAAAAPKAQPTAPAATATQVVAEDFTEALTPVLAGFQPDSYLVVIHIWWWFGGLVVWWFVGLVVV